MDERRHIDVVSPNVVPIRYAIWSNGKMVSTCGILPDNSLQRLVSIPSSIIIHEGFLASFHPEALESRPDLACHSQKIKARQCSYTSPTGSSVLLIDMIPAKRSTRTG